MSRLHMRSYFVSRAALLAALCALAAVPAVAGPAHQKVDRNLRRLVDEGGRTQNVIITVNPGCRAAVGTAPGEPKLHVDRCPIEPDRVDDRSAGPE